MHISVYKEIRVNYLTYIKDLTPAGVSLARCRRGEIILPK